MLNVVEWCVLLAGIFFTVTLTCLLVCKISRMQTRLASIDAKMKNDHADILRLSRQLETVHIHGIPSHIEEMSKMAKRMSRMSEEINILVRHSIAHQNDIDRERENLVDCNASLYKTYEQVLSIQNKIEADCRCNVSIIHGVKIDIQALKDCIVQHESVIDNMNMDILEEQSRLCRVMETLHLRVNGLQVMSVCKDTPVDAAQPAALEKTNI